MGYDSLIGTKIVHSYYPSAWVATIISVFLLSPYLSGCNVFSQTKTEGKPESPGAKGKDTKPAVEVAIAKTGLLQEPLEYTGKTEPVKEVSLRAQIEGRLLKLNVDIGDAVKQGQILA
ncbi:MAG TPA: efflux transporter periplasmic adaptor subunit, partial [Cyanobacteria bacterium UBA11166]|nr:efflux transporter periplasmic adaptor subunit [Cyanobacteria bacterium UBA11166]